MKESERELLVEEESGKEALWQEIMEYYEVQRDAKSQDNLVSLLREVQDLYGYIPAEKVAVMAERLGIKEAVILQLIKLYPSFRKASYSHCITVCTGARCGAQGASAIMDAVMKAAKANGDGKFKIVMKECLKSCGTAPNLTVDGDSYGNVRPEEVASILEKY